MEKLNKLKKKIEALRFGGKSEKLAVRHLKKMGYRILETNYRCRGGEIDIVAGEGNTLVFCEVKARRSLAFGRALEGISTAKVAKIKKAAEDYINKHGLKNMDCRFDVVTVEEIDSKSSIEIIRNAF